MKSSPITRALSCALLVVLAHSNSSNSQTYTWNGGSATTSNWSDGANWDLGLPTSDLANTFLIFDGANRLTPVQDLTLSANSLTFAASAGSFSITGTGVLTIGAGGIVNNSAVAQTFAAPITLGAAQAWTNNGAGLLTINGAVTNGANLLTINGSGNTTIGGIVGNGSGGITKSGTGTLTLSGVNTFTGNLSILSGTVIGTTSASAFGAGTIIIGDTAGSANATLNGGFAGTFTRPITVASGNTGTATITSSAAAIFSGAVTLSSHGLSLSPAASNLNLTGGITGTGNLTLNATGAGIITIATASVNMTGTITNSGAGTATNIISGGVGANVTSINQNSATSALTIQTTALTVNASGTTLINTAGTKILTVSGGISGTGNLVLNNNSALTSGITIATTAVNNTGTITNSGTGIGTVLISSVIGTNVTGVIQNSSTSQLNLTTGANTFTTGVTIRNGTVSGSVAASFGTGTITIGDSSGSANATLNAGGAVTHTNPISIASGNTGVATITSSAAGIFSGAITLNSHALRVAPSATNLTLSGAISGTGNITIATSGVGIATLSNATTVNPTGSITNSGTGTGTNVLSGLIGANVTSIIQNSATSALTISALNVSFAGGVTILAGTVNQSTGASALGTAPVLLGDLSGSANATLAATGTGLTATNAITVRAGSSGILTVSGINGNAFVRSGAVTLSNNVTIAETSTGSIQMSGGFTGTGNISLNASSTGAISLTTAAVNSVGTITNIGAGTGTATISAAVGTNVGNISLTGASPLTVSGAISLGGDRTYTNTGTAAFTISGAMSGTSNMTFAANNTGFIVLSGANTYTGTTTISSGVLDIVKQVSLYNNVTASWTATNIIVNSGATLAFNVGGTGEFTSANIDTLKALGTATGGFKNGSTLGLDTTNAAGGSFTYATGIANTNAGANVINFTKFGGRSLVLSGTNTYTGITTVAAGILQLGKEVSLYNNNTASWTAGNIIVNSGATLAFSVGVTGEFTSSDIDVLKTLGTASGGFLSGSAIGFDTTNAVGPFSYAGAITDTNAGANSIGLTKTGTGTLLLPGAHSYTGPTTILGGTLASSSDNNFPVTSALIIGDVLGRVGNLDLSTSNQAFASLTYNSASTTASIITVGIGKTLTINGNVFIGPNSPSANVVSKLAINGGGALNVNSVGGTFQVGGTNSAGPGADATLDLSGLASVTINLGATGTVRVNNAQATNNAGVQSTLLLPTPVVSNTTPVTTITANNFAVGDGASFNSSATQINRLVLGTGLTTLNVNTFNVGTGSSASSRDIGVVAFAGPNGALKIRAADGTSRAGIVVGGGSETTGTSSPFANNLVDLNGHNSDLLISTLIIGNQARIGNLISTFNFDTGALDATGIQVGLRSGTALATNTLTSILNLGGGTLTIGTGGLEIATNTNTSTTAANLIGTVNISGGNVTIGNSATLTAAVRLVNNSVVVGSLINPTGTLNITGGTVTVLGDIIKGAATGGGTTSAVLVLNGGTLDMTGKNIGGATAMDTLRFFSGTLLNVGQINNGASGLTKTNTGTLFLAGTNTYTGPTTAAGGLLVIDTTSSATVLNSASGLVAAGGRVQLRGAAATARTQVVNGLTVNAGNGSVEVDNLGTTTTFDLSGTGGTQGITRTTGGTVDFRAITGLLGVDAIIKTGQANDATGILGAWATINGGAAFASNNGTGSIVAYTGYTDINALGPNTLANNSNGNFRINSLGTSGSVPIAAATTNINTLTQNFSTASTIDTSPGTLRVGSVGGFFITPGSAGLTIGVSTGSGTVTAGGNAADQAGDLILENNSASPLVLNSSVTNNGAGVVSVTISGTGAVTLSGTNTFSGGVFLNSGALNINSATALGAAAGTFTIGNNTTIDSATGVTLANNNAQIWNGDFAFTGTTALNLGTGTVTIPNGVTRTVAVNNLTNSLTVGGTISGTGSSIVKTGVGILVLSAGNSYSGLTINAGTVAGLSITSFGTSSIVLGSSTGSADTTVVSAGAVTHTNPISVTAGNTGVATIGSIFPGATFSGAVTMNSHDLTVTTAGLFASGTLTLSGGITGTGSLTLNVQAGSPAGGALTISNAIDITGTITNSGAGPAGSTISAVLSANVGQVIQNSATSSLTLSGTNNNVNGVRILAGTLIVTADRNFGAVPAANVTNITIDGGVLQMNTGFNTSATRQIVIGVNGATFNNNATTNNFNVMGVIKDAVSGAGPLNIVGTGTTIYVPVAQNIYTGGTHLGATTTVVINSSSIGSASTADLVSGPFGTGTLFMDGAKQRASTGAGPWIIGNAVQITADSTFIAGSTNSLTFTGPVTLIGDRIITTNSPGDIIFTGVIGDGGLARALTLGATSTNKLTLAGNNTYTGLTTISAGTLQIGNGGASGNLTSDVVNNSALIFNRTDAFTFGQVISGTGTLTKNGIGSLSLTQSNTYGGGTTISTGTIAVNNTTGSGLGTGNVTVAAAGVLRGTGFVALGAANSVSVTGTVRGGNSIGTLNFTSTNVTLNNGAILQTEVSATGGNPDSGSNTTSSLLNLTGTGIFNLNLPTAGNKFTVDLSNTGVAFNQTGDYKIDLVVASTGNIQLNGAAVPANTVDPTLYQITGFSNFSNASLIVVQGTAGDYLQLSFTAVPEPHHNLLIGVVVLAIGIVIRRRQYQARIA